MSDLAEKSTEMIGRRFGRLVVLDDAPDGMQPNGDRYKRFWCQCDCGQRQIVRKSVLFDGQTRSCGCLRREITGNRSRTHGMSNTALRGVYNAMKQRCVNPHSHSYKNYGGRGIQCCDKWKTFGGFLEDMLPTYREGLTLERIDVNGPYCKENCSWIPMVQQQANRRDTLYVHYGGRRVRLKELALETGISYNRLWLRIYRLRIPVEVAVNMG